ncbi:hypothetical protein HHK36_021732 [Tetracentron sinense]|uniref:Uncharacterized protein n=1 Tax=Tetracentron sinense TaxID=13715 RepID=A0A834YVM7_TETSI|nr:hypothetical protein HHK36_021732 [Tetracentron sinense]
MAVYWTLSLGISYLHLLTRGGLFSRRKSSLSYLRCSPPFHTSTARPVCIVTGATSGLGAAAAYALSREGFYVVIEPVSSFIWSKNDLFYQFSVYIIEVYLVSAAGRSSQMLFKTIKEIKQRNADAHLKAFQVDLSSFQSMLKFKSSLQQWLLNSNMHASIQLLINNAGILATSCRVTDEGYDHMHDLPKYLEVDETLQNKCEDHGEDMAEITVRYGCKNEIWELVDISNKKTAILQLKMTGTNYIGAFALTNLLLPLLRNSRVPSRIVNVTSFTHRCVSDMQVDKETLAGKCFSKSKQYPFAHIYEYSKLCLLLFSYELHRQLGLIDKYRQVSIIAVDPGIVETNIMREVPACLSHLAFVVLKLLGLLQSPENGVNSIIDAALAPPELSGEYFFGGRGRTISSSALSYDTKLAEMLWESSCKLLQELHLAAKEEAS